MWVVLGGGLMVSLWQLEGWVRFGLVDLQGWRCRLVRVRGLLCPVPWKVSVSEYSDEVTVKVEAY